MELIDFSVVGMIFNGETESFGLFIAAFFAFHLMPVWLYIGGLTICDISDYQRVFSMIKDLQTDIYADTMYPNDLRPNENHGYQTQYVNKDWQ